MSDRPICVGCTAIAPETNTSHTLISASFGWRLSRRRLQDGTYALEWRCSDCWRKHKVGPMATVPPQDPAAQTGSTTSHGGFKKRS
jgi:hypothetical protein